MANRAAFLDRDRTIIEDPGYISDPSLVRLLPGADLAIRSLKQAGYRVIVVTNQSAIARGLLTEEALEKIHGEMRRQLAAGGAHVDAVYFCPFHPEGTVKAYARDSDLRKPQPGMLRKGAQEFDLDLAASWMIGDSARDVEAGQRAGCRTIRLRAGPPSLAAESEDENVQPDFVVRNLLEAAKMVLQAPPPSPPRAAAATPPAPAGPGPASGAPKTDREILLEILQQVRELARELKRRS